MLPLKTDSESSTFNCIKSFKCAFKELALGACMKKSSFRKRSGTGIVTAVQMLIMIVFGPGSNINQYFQGKYHPRGSTSKSALYEILKNGHFNWRKLLNLLAERFVINSCCPDSKPRFLIGDSTCYYRNRSKYVEMLSYNYDHAKKQMYKGLKLVCLAWSDGKSCIPCDFAIQTSNKRVNKERDDARQYDRRSLSFLRRKEALMSQTELLKAMVKKALAMRITADCLLLDSWYCFHSFIQEMYDSHIHVICMMKNMRCNRYALHRHDRPSLDLKQLISRFANRRQSDICGSVIVYLRTGLPIKLVFVRNRHSQKDILVIGSTDTTLNAEEIRRYYEHRWKIECLFKLEKQHLGLEKECMARSFDAIWAHLVIVNIRAIFLVWINIHKDEPGTLSRLFYECSEDNKIICRAPDFEYICSKLQTNIEKIQKKGVKRKNLNHALEEADHVLLERLICWLLTSIKSIFSTG